MFKKPAVRPLWKVWWVILVARHEDSKENENEEEKNKEDENNNDNINDEELNMKNKLLLEAMLQSLGGEDNINNNKDLKQKPIN